MGLLFDQSRNYNNGSLFTCGVMFIGNMATLFLPSTEWQIKFSKYPELSYNS